jgi:hypothetical protein
VKVGACSCKLGIKCTAAGKHPLVAWRKADFPAVEQVEAWWRRWPRANLGVLTGRRSGLVLLDVDGVRGLNTLRQLVTDLEHPLPRTLMARSGRVGGGWHAYFAIGERETTNATIDGLDFRGDGGLAVLPPSLHASGATYQWIDATVPPALMPADVLAWLEARGGRRKPKAASLELPAHLRGRPTRDLLAHSDTDPPPGTEDIAAALAVIPNPDLGWDPFNAILMTIWAACRGGEWGIALADAWARKSKKYVEGQTELNWTRITSCPPTDLRFNSLVYKAREAVPGWEPPSRQVRLIDPFEGTREEALQPAAQSDPANETETNGHAFPFHGEDGRDDLLFGEDLRKKQEEKSLNPLIELNNKYSVIGDIGGKCLVLSWVPSKVDEQVKVPSFQSFKSFSERYANKYVLIKSTNSKGEDTEKFEQLGSHWLKWPSRRSYEGIDLDPSGDSILPNGHLNLWSGFAVEPRAGDWSLMKRHIADVLAAGDADAALYITRFAAWAIQHPGERAEVALVFRGGKGSGKGTFANALKRLFGAHGLQIYSSKHLVGAFNGHLRSCLLLFADEAFWAGDKQGESVLKGMLTEATLMVEQKGIDATPWRNRLHVIMAANAEWVVPASHDERRYAMFSVDNKHIGDRPYFQALHHEVNHGGLAAMLHDLQRVGLGDWHPREIAQTKALRDQKERSMKPFDTWWLNLLQDGILPFQMSGQPAKARASAIIGHFRESIGRAADLSYQTVAKNLAALQCDRTHTRDGSVWVFPALRDARGAWCAKFGLWEWEKNQDEWTNLLDLKPANPSPSSRSVTA